MRARTSGIGRLRPGAALVLALAPSGARAAEPDALTQEPPAIVGGEASEPCEWPSVVALRTGGLCTGTLVHPRVVVYAAHCGTLHTQVLFGEDVEAPAREIPTLRCERFSDLFAVSSMDYAYCELAEPVTDVAITPLLFGCDEALIEVGAPVTIVGFGDTSSEGPEQTGIKHAAQTQIVDYLSTVGIGGMGTGADVGDSGGPALIQLDDGSWRVLGIVSGGGGDGAAVRYVPAPKTVAWIEDRTGIDITPCHASDGSWAPSPACEGLFVAVEAGASWAEGCPGPVSPPSQRCGPPWTSLEDHEPPSVAFVEPLDGAVYEGAPVELEVIGEATDAGVGVRELRLLIDGQPWIDALGREAVDQVPPYRFEGVTIELDGVHELALEAVDQLDNASTALATITLGEPPGAGESGDTGASEDTDDETGPTGDGEDDGALGCACASTRGEPGGKNGPGLALLLAVLGLSASARGPRSRRTPRAVSPRRR